MFTLAGLLIAPLLATASPSQPPHTADLDSSSMTLVVVQNDRNVPVTVYVQTDATEARLAVVAPMTDSTIRIPDYLTAEGEVSFFVHPNSETDEGTTPIEVGRGEHVGLVVPAKPRG
jgi:hypothetical protein